MAALLSHNSFYVHRQSETVASEVEQVIAFWSKNIKYASHMLNDEYSIVYYGITCLKKVNRVSFVVMFVSTWLLLCSFAAETRSRLFCQFNDTVILS